MENANRLKLINELPYFIRNVKLSGNILTQIEAHAHFTQYREGFRVCSTEELPTFVLIELTQDKTSRDILIDLFRSCKQDDVADWLQAFNKYPEPMLWKKGVNIKVFPVNNPIFPNSKAFSLMKRSRGICLIINNLENKQFPDFYDEQGNLVFKPKGLKRETLRIENVFSQLYFDVKIANNLNVKQMQEILIRLSEDQSLATDEAFVLFVISHGINKKVYGYSACEIMRKINYNLIDPDDQRAQEIIEMDSIEIKDVIKLFAQDKCLQLKSKPKLLFFICCRTHCANETGFTEIHGNFQEFQMNGEDIESNNTMTMASCNHHNTFVSYSCTKGFDCLYDLKYGMTYFGLALTHSIANYSNTDPLSGIICRTSDLLRKIFVKLKEKERKAKRQTNNNFSNLKFESFAIEVNTYSMDRDLYFNPLYFKKC